jgi:hypothetical protein
MAAGAAQIGGVVRRRVSFAAAVIALIMLVASGGSHELLHGDDGPPSAQRSVAGQAGEVASRERHAPNPRPLHGCNHCIAHVADAPPVTEPAPAPLGHRARWEPSLASCPDSRASACAERPPRI